MRELNGAYRSPFFSPDFVHAVNEVQPGVEVAIERENGSTTAILPFRRGRGNSAFPVGAGINDAQGLLVRPDHEIDFMEFLHACGLNSYHFHAAPIDCPGVQEFELGRANAYLADLTRETEDYPTFLRRRNRTIDKQGQKTRKLAREVGPLRFEFDCRDPDLIARLIELKSQQYQRTHTYDILSKRWIQELMFGLHATRESETRGLLSVLFAADIPVAIHFGMIEGDLVHYWFPAYDHEYQFASPGTQLFLDVATQAPDWGVRFIDMGYGEQAYKHKLTNVITEMSFGLADNRASHRLWYRGKKMLARQMKMLPARDRLKPWARTLMPFWGGHVYRD